MNGIRFLILAVLIMAIWAALTMAIICILN
jgi:hypothetical protein